MTDFEKKMRKVFLCKIIGHKWKIIPTAILPQCKTQQEVKSCGNMYKCSRCGKYKFMSNGNAKKVDH